MRTACLPTQLLLLGISSISAMGCGQSSGPAVGNGGTASSVTGIGGAGTGGGSSRGGSVGTNSTAEATSGGALGNGGTASSDTRQGSGGVQEAGGTASGNSTTSSSTVSGGSVGTGGKTTGRTSSTSIVGAGGTGIGGRATSGATSGGGSSGITGTGGTSKPVSNGGAATGGATDGTAGSRSAGGATSSGSGTSTTDATIVPDPSWTCGMADGIPSPTLGELVFRATLQLGATHDVGNTQFGHRRILDVKGGTLKGDRVEATFMNLGLDLELTLSNGSIELEQINILKASDGTLIYMRNCGVAPAGDSVVRVVADFEVPTSKSLAWLNTGKYVGTRVVNSAASTLQLDVYEVSKVTAAATKIQLKDPAGVPNVSWDCVAGSGSQGATVFTENVTLGSSVSIGASKRGNRNIIPITGGTTTGKVEGAILAGGGDYQLSGLDARYTLAPKDGEFILVRNCGPTSSLFPVFEARADGPYAFLNENKYISSAPGAGSGGVSITFYERK